MLTLFLSCQSQADKKQIKDCDGLAMKYYRGLPKPSKLYKLHCEKKLKSLIYTPQICEKAMANLMLSGSEKRLKKIHGDRIMECFNRGDLQRFLSKPILKK